MKHFPEDMNASDWEIEVNKSKYFREIIKKVLTSKLESAILSLSGEQLTLSPNYAISIADSLGYQRALRECINLIEQDMTDA